MRHDPNYGAIIIGITGGILAVIWLYHYIECLRRKDLRAADKIFWVIVLAMPLAGIILYRALGRYFYKTPGRTKKVRQQKPPWKRGRR